MGKPKKQTSSRKTGLRRSHLSLALKRKVNSLLSKAGKKVKAITTKRETGAKKAKAVAKPKKAAAKKEG